MTETSKIEKKLRLLPGAATTEEDFERRKITAESLGNLAAAYVEAEFPGVDIEAYETSTWRYGQFIHFAMFDLESTQESAVQVFRRWHHLTARELDLIPVTYESAKKLDYPASLLGALVIANTIRTPVSSRLLGEYHWRITAQLTQEA